MDLITRLLDKNPATRLGAANDYQDILNHSWFSDIDMDLLLKKKLEAPI